MLHSMITSDTRPLHAITRYINRNLCNSIVTLVRNAAPSVRDKLYTVIYHVFPKCVYMQGLVYENLKRSYVTRCLQLLTVVYIADTV